MMAFFHTWEVDIQTLEIYKWSWEVERVEPGGFLRAQENTLSPHKHSSLDSQKDVLPVCTWEEPAHKLQIET